VLASLRKKGYITGTPSNGRGQYHIRVVKYFKKASTVTPSVSEGVHSDTLMPNKASVVTPYQEVKQEERPKVVQEVRPPPIKFKKEKNSGWETRAEYHRRIANGT